MNEKPPTVLDDNLLKLAEAAGLTEALAAFPKDVRVAASGAAQHRASLVALTASAGAEVMGAVKQETTSSEEAHWLGVADIASAFANRQLSPVQLLESLLKRIAKLDPQLNVFIHLDAEFAMEAARL